MTDHRTPTKPITTRPGFTEITKQDVEDAIGLILSWIELDKDGAVASMTIGCPQLNHSYNIRIERVPYGEFEPLPDRVIIPVKPH